MTISVDPIEVQLLADNEKLIATIGEMRWREWGHAPEPEDLGWWIDVTAREAGRDRLPMTWVASMHGAKRAVRWVSASMTSTNEEVVRPGCWG